MKLTYSLNAFLCVGLACLALGGSACGTSDSGIESASDAGTDEPVPTDASALMCTGTQTASCMCTNGKAGRKTCHSGKYSGCVCETAVVPDAGLSTVDLCKAGYYTGGFTGTYNPGAFGFGLFMSGFQVTINGAEAHGVPALAFNLNENDTGPAGEFHTFTVGNGCMTGSAQAVGTDNPFVARISGSLDCGTGYFEGRLDGYYSLIGITGLTYYFSGPLTSQFYLPQSLKDGEWSVAEPDALLGGAQGGGSGTWNADWASDNGPDAAVDPCATVPPVDSGVYGAAAFNDAGFP